MVRETVGLLLLERSRSRLLVFDSVISQHARTLELPYSGSEPSESEALRSYFQSIGVASFIHFISHVTKSTWRPRGRKAGPGTVR